MSVGRWRVGPQNLHLPSLTSACTPAARPGRRLGWWIAGSVEPAPMPARWRHAEHPRRTSRSPRAIRPWRDPEVAPLLRRRTICRRFSVGGCHAAHPIVRTSWRAGTRCTWASSSRSGRGAYYRACGAGDTSIVFSASQTAPCLPAILVVAALQPLHRDEPPGQRHRTAVLPRTVRSIRVSSSAHHLFRSPMLREREEASPHVNDRLRDARDAPPTRRKERCDKSDDYASMLLCTTRETRVPQQIVSRVLGRSRPIRASPFASSAPQPPCVVRGAPAHSKESFARTRCARRVRVYGIRGVSRFVRLVGARFRHLRTAVSHNAPRYSLSLATPAVARAAVSVVALLRRCARHLRSLAVHVRVRAVIHAQSWRPLQDRA